MNVQRKSRVRLGMYLPVVVAIAVTAAAAPALAAPLPTTLTDSPQSSTVNWNSTAILNGVLQTLEPAPRPLDQQQLRVERSASQSGPWTLVTTVTNMFAPYSSGAYAHAWRADRTAWWRMTFLGTAEWSAAEGAAVRIGVKPLVGKPACPKSVKAKKKFSVSGSLKPRFDARSKTVRVKAYRYVNRTWRFYRSYTATNADSGAYSKYSARFSIAKKGKYRFRAFTSGTSQFAAAASAHYSRSLRVR